MVPLEPTERTRAAKSPCKRWCPQGGSNPCFHLERGRFQPRGSVRHEHDRALAVSIRQREADWRMERPGATGVAPTQYATAHELCRLSTWRRESGARLQAHSSCSATASARPAPHRMPAPRDYSRELPLTARRRVRCGWSAALRMGSAIGNTLARCRAGSSPPERERLLASVQQHAPATSCPIRGRRRAISWLGAAPRSWRPAA